MQFQTIWRSEQLALWLRPYSVVRFLVLCYRDCLVKVSDISWFNVRGQYFICKGVVLIIILKVSYNSVKVWSKLVESVGRFWSKICKSILVAIILVEIGRLWSKSLVEFGRKVLVNSDQKNVSWFSGKISSTGIHCTYLSGGSGWWLWVYRADLKHTFATPDQKAKQAITICLFCTGTGYDVI